MKPEFENIPLNINETNKRFELEYNGHLAFINYGEFGKSIALVHTEAEPELKGTGAASALVEKTLTHLKEEGKEILPYCPYVFAYIKRHPEWKEIVNPQFPGYNQINAQ
ncbi:N-acetyltransferase [Flavobacteriaceae bacterium Ap0902]|nr:N-acetyltransferase [Flavobacteriaceae bacterium Ap0902]